MYSTDKANVNYLLCLKVPETYISKVINGLEALVLVKIVSVFKHTKA